MLAIFMILYVVVPLTFYAWGLWKLVEQGLPSIVAVGMFLYFAPDVLRATTPYLDAKLNG